MEQKNKTSLKIEVRAPQTQPLIFKNEMKIASLIFLPHICKSLLERTSNLSSNLVLRFLLK